PPDRPWATARSDVCPNNAPAYPAHVLRARGPALKARNIHGTKPPGAAVARKPHDPARQSVFVSRLGRGRSGPRPPGQVAFPDRGENGSRTGADLDIDLGRDGRYLGVDLHRGDSHRLSHPHRFDDVLEHAARADTEDDVEASAKLVP